MTLEYCGVNYHGWARQPGILTIEGVLLDKLEKILQEKPNLIISGRTDAGVHAKGQIVNFLTKKEIPNDALKRALNILLPNDIQILKVVDVNFEFHSRYFSKKKDYQYVIARKYSVFEKGLVFYCSYKLDLDIMRKAAGVFVGEHNFKKFSLTDKTREKINTIRNLYELDIISKRNKIILNFSGEGFLRGMVRSIGGILVDAGRGRIGLDTVKKALKGDVPIKEKWSLLPADGLYLMKVYY
ncbi:MAG: tRNA pseudouridine(38-40) synthase TruA [bacterium]